MSILATSTLLLTLSTTPQPHPTYTKIVTEYVGLIKTTLETDTSKEATVCNSIIGICSANPSILEPLLKMILESIETEDLKIDHKRMIMLALISCIKSRSIHINSNNNSKNIYIFLTILVTFEDDVFHKKTKLFELFSLGLSSSDTKTVRVGIEGLKELYISPQLLPKETLELALDYLNSVIITCEDKDIIDATSEALLKVSFISNGINKTIERVFTALEGLKEIKKGLNGDVDMDFDKKSMKLSHYSSVLLKLGENTNFCEAIIQKLVESVNDLDYSSIYCNSIFKTTTDLLKVFGKTSSQCDMIVNLFLGLLLAKSNVVENLESIQTCKALVSIAMRYSTNQYVINWFLSLKGSNL